MTSSCRARNNPEASADAMLPGTAIVRFISALGQRATDRAPLRAQADRGGDDPRDGSAQLGLNVGDRCTISLRQPRFYSRADAEKSARSEGANRARLRYRRRERAAL